MGGIDDIVSLSRRFGGDPDWVLAGGGNSSWKDPRTLYVKASGRPMATIGPDGFCAIDRKKLDAMWDADYPRDPQGREAAALASLLAARLPGEEKRPSVETLMHGLFPQAFVMHTHPSAINGLTCSKDGEKAFLRLFKDEAIWVPFVDPGYVLARTVRSAFAAFSAERGFTPRLMFMQNHGLLVCGDSPEEINAVSGRVLETVKSELKRLPDLSGAAVDPAAIARAAQAVSRLAGESAVLRFRADSEILKLSASKDAFAAIGSAFTPDHIVYSGHEYLYAEPGTGDIESEWKAYAERNGQAPRICLLRGLGAFAVGPSPKAAETALDLFVDACRIAAYAESFGGPSHMRKENIDFIRNWEVERFRSSVNSGA